MTTSHDLEQIVEQAHEAYQAVQEVTPDTRAWPTARHWCVNVPIGVVAVFGASNFPFAFSVTGGDPA